MKAIVIAPPAYTVEKRVSALSVLATILRDRCSCDVAQVDANIEIFKLFLQKRTIAHLMRRLRERYGSLKHVRKGDGLSSEEERARALRAHCYLHFQGRYASLFADYAQELRRGLSYSRYLNRYAVLNERLSDIISLAYPEYSFGVLAGLHYVGRTTSRSIREQLKCETPYHYYFRNSLCGMIENARANVICLSVSFRPQLLSSLIFAREIKKRFGEDTKVCLGGAYISMLFQIKGFVRRHISTFRDVDYVGLFEGETSLPEIVARIFGRRKDAASRATIIEPVKKPKSLRITRLNQTAALASPTYAGVDLSGYVPRNEDGFHLTYAVSRGCYWDKCTFCSERGTHGAPYAARAAADALLDLERIKKESGIRYVSFTDAAPPLPLLRAISVGIRRRRMGIKWTSQARPERLLLDVEVCRDLANGGCQSLSLGLESASPRIHEWIDKGIDPAIMPRILRNLYSVGIKVHLFLIYGLPFEQDDDLWLTIAFLKKHRRLIYSFQAEEFTLLYHSRMAQVLRQVFHWPYYLGKSFSREVPAEIMKEFEKLKYFIKMPRGRSITAPVVLPADLTGGRGPRRGKYDLISGEIFIPNTR